MARQECEDDELLNKNEEMFRNISNKIGKEFFAELIFGNDYGTYIKTKIPENRTPFAHNKIPKKETDYRCKVLIRIESVYFKSDESKHYAQIFLYNRRLHVDSSDESDNMPVGEEEEQSLNGDYKSDKESNNKSEKSG